MKNLSEAKIELVLTLWVDISRNLCNILDVTLDTDVLFTWRMRMTNSSDLSEAGLHVRPRNVRHSRFCGSEFGDAQVEIMLSCIAITQFKMNPEAWTPFSWEEYCHHCDHNPENVEKQFFDAMADGGVVSFLDMGKWKSFTFRPGYLRRQGDKYLVTEQLLKVMQPYVK